MDIRIIKSPSTCVINMLKGRSTYEFPQVEEIGAIGLVQGKLTEMLLSADIAEKSSDIEVVEVKGMCPQHFTMIAILGDISSVNEALDSISQKSNERWKSK